MCKGVCVCVCVRGLRRAQGSEQTPLLITLCQGFFFLIFGKHKGLFILSAFLPVVKVLFFSHSAKLSTFLFLPFFFFFILLQVLNLSFLYFELLSNDILAVILLP